MGVVLTIYNHVALWVMACYRGGGGGIPLLFLITRLYIGVGTFQKVGGGGGGGRFCVSFTAACKFAM